MRNSAASGGTDTEIWEMIRVAFPGLSERSNTELLAAFEEVSVDAEAEAKKKEVLDSAKAEFSLSSLSKGVVPLVAIIAVGVFSQAGVDLCATPLANEKACNEREAIAKGEIVLETPLDKYSRELVGSSKAKINAAYERPQQ